MPVELFQKASTEKNAARTSNQTTGLFTQPSVWPTTGTSHVQATGDAVSFTAIQPVQTPCARFTLQLPVHRHGPLDQ